MAKILFYNCMVKEPPETFWEVERTYKQVIQVLDEYERNAAREEPSLRSSQTPSLARLTKGKCLALLRSLFRDFSDDPGADPVGLDDLPARVLPAAALLLLSDTFSLAIASETSSRASSFEDRPRVFSSGDVFPPLGAPVASFSVGLDGCDQVGLRRSLSHDLAARTLGGPVGA